MAITTRCAADCGSQEINIRPATIAIVYIWAPLPVALVHISTSWDPIHPWYIRGRCTHRNWLNYLGRIKGSVGNAEFGPLIAQSHQLVGEYHGAPSAVQSGAGVVLVAKMVEGDLWLFEADLVSL